MGIRENLSFSCKNRSDYDKSYQEIFLHTEATPPGGLTCLCIRQSNLCSSGVTSLLLQPPLPPVPSRPLLV